MIIIPEWGFLTLSLLFLQLVTLYDVYHYDV